MLGSVIIIGAVVLWPASNPDIEIVPLQQKIGQADAAAVIEKPKSAEVFNKVKKERPKPLESLSVEQGMRHEMQRVADIYEQRSRYAPYSLYLSPNQTDLIKPNQSHESPRAYEVDSYSVSILIKPQNYRFSLGEKINVDIQIESSSEGLKAITNILVEVASISSKKQWPMKFITDVEQKGMRTIKAELDLSSETGELTEQDYSVMVRASFNNESPVIQSAPIKIFNSIAKVRGLNVQHIDNNDLIIPVKIDADKSGYYQLSASLFDAASNSAISFVIAKERLNSGSNTLNARVQGLVLRDKGFSGPFRLQGITLVKKSERPGMQEEYGIADESYEVDRINLDDFESIPYEDPMTEQRLEFMRSIAR